jgi:hypothetical protein
MHVTDPRAHRKRGLIWLLVIGAALWLTLAYAGTAVADSDTPPADHGAPLDDVWKANEQSTENSSSAGMTSPPAEEQPEAGSPPTSSEEATGVADETTEVEEATSVAEETTEVEEATSVSDETPPDVCTPPSGSTPSDTPDSCAPPAPPTTPEVCTPPSGSPPSDTPDSCAPPETPSTPEIPSTPETPATPPTPPSTQETPLTPVAPPQPPTPAPPATPEQPPSPPESTQPEAPPLGPLEEDRGGVEAEQETESVPGVTNVADTPAETTVAAGQTGSTAGALPFTGGESLIVALFGLMALGLGTGLRRAVRQKA